MSGRIMNQEQRIAKEKVRGTEPRVVLSVKDPVEYNRGFAVSIFTVGAAFHIALATLPGSVTAPECSARDHSHPEC